MTEREPRDPRANEFVTIAVLHDPVQADTLRDLLDQEGIVAMTPGAQHRTMLGLLGPFVEIPLRVRRDDADEARAILDALENADAIVDDLETFEEPSRRFADDPRALRSAAGQGPYRIAPLARRGGDSPRLARIAAFCSFALTFGAGHFYSREHVAGSVLALGQLVALGLALLGVPWIAAAVPGLVFVDVVGATRAARRFNAGKRLGARAQALRTVPATVGVLAFAAVGLPLIVDLAPAATAGSARHLTIHADMTAPGEDVDPATVWQVREESTP